MKKRWKWLLPLIAVIILFLIVYFTRNGVKAVPYQFDTVKRGNLESKVSSTGTIQALRTVEVGTQVSGIIDRLYSDFNDNVHKGQLMAVLDTVLLKSALQDAQANLEKIQAQVEQARADYQRSVPLLDKGLISEAEFLPLKTSLKTQEANLSSAESGLQRAERNLKYAFIRSPIDGKVIQRNVEEGQTVAASLQAPTLFILAEDLSKMEIHAQVDESDIGLIKEGQEVSFSVQAYTSKVFSGVVRQIRLQPETLQNVVNYTVVIDAANKEYLLLPGMTAMVDFIVDKKTDVLLVPNAALRFSPPAEEMQKILAARRKQFESMPDSVRQRFGGRLGNAQGGFQGGPPPDMAGSGRRREMGTVWYLDKDKKLAMARFLPGMTDGKSTEVVRSREITEGMQVITGLQTAKTTTSTQSPQGPRGGMGPMF